MSRSSMRARDCWSTPAMDAAIRSRAVPNAPAAAQADPPPGVGDAAANASSTSRRGLSAKEATNRLAGSEREDLFFAVALFLLAHVVERVAERLNRRFDRGLDVAPLQF